MVKKTRRRKFNIIKFVIVLICIYIMGFGVYQLVTLPIRHIRILNTTYLHDQDILRETHLDDYPSFLLTMGLSIKKDLENNPYIKDVKVEKKWFGRLYLYITEYRILFYNQMGQLILEDNRILDDVIDKDAPRLINEVPSVLYNKFIDKMSIIDSNVLLKISEIEYRPNEVDKERFLLTMNDGNYVYLTLYTYEKVNKYDKILPTLEQKKGILYLDSGNYFEIID